ncbi:hypothetical protein NP493_216g01024 [Ridgeia piscesae]|uniref:Reverse transcriptase domain-containing protein n=1 Tax=Ridgeia piscesae TaxID=27915 RepID=A0AAD9P0S3_RIDPI|nr:hypothetical protein NP493_216g01024 [Ridgeia piscesae]
MECHQGPPLAQFSSLYAGPIGQIIRRHHLDFHLFADDSQLYVSFKIKDTNDETIALARIQACVGELKAWMIHHRHQLNDSKTEVIIGDNIFKPTTVDRNLRVTLDSAFNVTSKVSQLRQAAYYQLHKIRPIRHCLTQHATELLVHSLVISRLDYGNSLLYCLPDSLLEKLQEYKMQQLELLWKSVVRIT